MQDRSGTKETDAGDDLGRHPRPRVSAAEALDGSDREQRGAHSDKGVRTRTPAGLPASSRSRPTIAPTIPATNAHEAFDLWVMQDRIEIQRRHAFLPTMSSAGQRETAMRKPQFVAIYFRAG